MTPETILARFAAAYAEHGAGDDHLLTLEYQPLGWHAESGYITNYAINDKSFWWIVVPASEYMAIIAPEHITRIDYSNARYRDTAPLWQREEQS